jgi:hypothetical protein
MEDCVSESPSAFVGRQVAVTHRQANIEGFIPDLILTCSDGKEIVLEIQQRALDRYHLYKSLEYRDLYADKFSREKPDVYLLCEMIDDRFRKLLQTHNIKLIELNREKFIELAVAHSPNAIVKHLSSDGDESDEKPALVAVDRFQFNPLKWGAGTKPTDVLGHLYREFGRLNVDLHKLPRKYYAQIFYDICDVLDEDLERVLGSIWIPGAWNLNRLRQRQPMIQEWRPIDKLAKPRIDVIPHITKKGNLSVIWRPGENDEENETDWLWWPGDGTYGWGRPNNELIFIREVSHLHPGLFFHQWDDRVNYDVLDGIFIGLIKACFDHFISVLRVPFDVNLVNDIELDLVPAEKDEEPFRQKVIVGWRIFSIEERARQASDQWVAEFESTHGLSLQLFAKMARLSTIGPKAERVPISERKMTAELRKLGLKFTESEVRQILLQFKDHHEPNIRDLLR